MGGRERNENTHPPAMLAFVHQFYCRFNRKVALLQSLAGIPVIFDASEPSVCRI